MLRNEIISNWENDIVDHLRRIESLKDSYPAYTIKSGDRYGVAVPMERDIDVNEDFSNAKLKTEQYNLSDENRTRTFLTLMTNKRTDRKAFSALCEQFVFPGTYGEFRKELIESPIKWWMEMKQILGNKNVESMIYDTLGELWVYDYYIRQGLSVSWNGPMGSSSDLELDEMMVEVKSTLNRTKKEITVHGMKQLVPPENKKLFLFYCVFEMSTTTGESINDIVNKLFRDGYQTEEIERLLAKKGFEPGKSSRDKKFILWDVYRYEVNEAFPHLSEKSFIDGIEPEGIRIESYVVNLSNMPFERIVEDNNLL
jgi:hypothetical protein